MKKRFKGNDSVDSENIQAGHAAEKNTGKRIEVVDYNTEKKRSYSVRSADPERIAALADIPENLVRWVNIDGKCESAVLQNLGKAFRIHPLIIRNISNHTQRAKIEEYQKYLHIVAKMLYYARGRLVVEHVNLILGPRYVITVGETEGDVFDEIRLRLQNKDSYVRAAGPDYLAYLLLDAIVEGYFDVLDVLDQKIDELEEQVMSVTSQDHLHAIREIKKELLLVNKNIRPLRDVAAIIEKPAASLIQPSTQPYLRDIYNHIVQAIDSTETSRELLSGLTDLHMSNTSYKLNEIMKVLTIISTLFIPLTFIVGVYGMNFRYMPELEWKWGYGITWIVMIVISCCMVCFFKKKKWF